MIIVHFFSATSADCFTSIEIKKKIFHHSMPTHWHIDSINSGPSIQGTSIESLHTYIVQQESQTDEISFAKFIKYNKNSKRYSSDNQKQETRNINLQMIMTAPPTALAINWGSVIRTRMGITLAKNKHILCQSPISLKDDPNSQHGTVDFQYQYKCWEYNVNILLYYDYISKFFKIKIMIP